MNIYLVILVGLVAITTLFIIGTYLSKYLYENYKSKRAKSLKKFEDQEKVRKQMEEEEEREKKENYRMRYIDLELAKNLRERLMENPFFGKKHVNISVETQQSWIRSLDLIIRYIEIGCVEKSTDLFVDYGDVSNLLNRIRMTDETEEERESFLSLFHEALSLRENGARSIRVYFNEAVTREEITTYECDNFDVRAWNDGYGGFPGVTMETECKVIVDKPASFEVLNSYP